MSISLGIYDVFSYAIPGILYMFTFNEMLRLLKLPCLDITQVTNAFHFLLLGMLAYLVGHLFDYISHYIWYRLFYPGKSEQRAYTQIKSLPGVKVEFEPMQWSILLSVIRHNNMEVCNTIDKNKATSVMLRNVSFALFLLTIILTISAFSPVFSLVFLLGALAALAGSIVSLRRGDMFNQWFYMLIYQQSLSYGSSLKDVLENIRPKVTKEEKPIGKPEKRG